MKISQLKQYNTLPLAMKIAAGAESISNIRVVPVYSDTGVIHTASVLKIGNWEERLVQQCIIMVNADIDAALKKNKNSTFFIFALNGLFYMDGLFKICVDLNYKLE